MFIRLLNKFLKIQIPFTGTVLFNGIQNGWTSYYATSSGNKFTEEQFRLANEAAGALDNCYPIEEILDGITHAAICQNLRKGDFAAAKETLDYQIPSLTKRGWCIEALKFGISILGLTSPETVRRATLNLLACDQFFTAI